MWARSHRPFHLGVSGSSAPVKPKPASTAGKAPVADDLPASSSKRTRTSKSAPDLGARVLHSGQKSKASGGKSKVLVSDDESSGSSVEIISGPSKSLGPHRVCVPVNPEKEASRLANGRPRPHQDKSSAKALRATNPAPDALTAEVLEMLPDPRHLVCVPKFLLYSFSYLYI
jgi:hypothetical protein